MLLQSVVLSTGSRGARRAGLLALAGGVADQVALNFDHIGQVAGRCLTPEQLGR